MEMQSSPLPGCSNYQRNGDETDAPGGKMKSLRPHRKDPSVYCDAALVTLEDLEEHHGRGEHCEKKRVGDPISIMSLGFPIFDEKSETLVSLLQLTKNEGVLERELNLARPKNMCSNQERSVEGNALSIQQLTGIWVIVFGFAICGIMARLLNPMTKKLGEKESMKVKSLIRVDQWGNPTCHDVITKGSKFDMDTKTFESTGIREKQKFQLAGFDATLKPIEWATEEIFSAEQCRIED